MVKIREVTDYLETIAPLALQEDYDNAGLLTGNGGDEVKGILITLDITEKVVEEAEKLNCNLIIAHHPIIFRGLKKLTGSNYVERTVIAAIKKNIALYAIHTNLDNIGTGVNKKICDKIGLINTHILSPKKNLLKKLVTFIPVSDTDKVMKAVYEAGAGQIGNYSECSFQLTGTGTFKPNEKANPTIGEPCKLENVEERRVEVIYPFHRENSILKALKAVHPYEEPAFDLIMLENQDLLNGAGMVGELEKEMEEKEFLVYLKQRMDLQILKHTPYTGNKIKRIAVCGGSGNFLLRDALRTKADVFITADFKYHEYFDADGRILIADIGHYESEVFTKDLIYEILNEKFSNIALVLSKTNTNPISYL